MITGMFLNMCTGKYETLNLDHTMQATMNKVMILVIIFRRFLLHITATNFGQQKR